MRQYMAVHGMKSYSVSVCYFSFKKCYQAFCFSLGIIKLSSLSPTEITTVY